MGSDDGARGVDRLPWKPATRQEIGRQEEAKTIKRMGLRAHPGSGSGKIRFDGSDDEHLMEHKVAGSSFTLSGSYVAKLLTEAIRQGKRAGLVVYFDKLNITCTITMRKGKPE